MTQREFFNVIANGQGTVTDKEGAKKVAERTINVIVNGELNPELITYAQESIKKLDNKNANRKGKNDLKKETEDKELIDQIYSGMKSDVTYTCSEISYIIQQTTQKTKPLLNRMISMNMVTKIDDFKPTGRSKGVGYIKN